MIIGLVGYDNSGKDTVAAYLIKEHGFERRAFADPGKRSIGAFFDLTQEQIEAFKNDDTVYVSIGYKTGTPSSFDVDGDDWQPGIDFPEEILPHNMWSPIYEMTFREALRRYMTQAHREVFSEDFWVEQTLPVGGFYSGRKIVVSDVRFTSEADRINELGGTLVKVRRPGITTPQEGLYQVEQISVDYELVNESSVDVLYASIEGMLNLEFK